MKQTILILIIMLAVIGGWFYWFQWRPSEIRKECYQYVKKRAVEKNWDNETVKLAYDLCLHDKGL